jgi:hypothetical protein
MFTSKKELLDKIESLRQLLTTQSNYVNTLNSEINILRSIIKDLNEDNDKSFKRGLLADKKPLYDRIEQILIAAVLIDKLYTK